MTAVGGETRAAIRALIMRSIREGIPTYDAAHLIRSMIGLSQRQAGAVLTYRAQLVESGQAHAVVEKAVQKLVARKLRQRSLTIARTELLGSLNAGMREGWAQAQEKGHLGPAARKVWVAQGENCPVCQDLDGQSVPLNEPFAGGFDGPPAHPRCTCAQALDPGGR